MKKPEAADTAGREAIEAGLVAYQDAGLSGLCSEGRWEAAVEAMRSAGPSASLTMSDLFTQLASAIAAERDPVEWPGAESNCRHADFQSAALPTELPGREG